MSDRNRDGMDDDLDRRPGNSSDSPSYARRFDPRSEQEFTNLPEPQHIMQAENAQQNRERMRARRAMQAAQQDVHYFPDVGKFIIPAANTWAAHAELVQNNDMRLHFNPKKYFFDKIIADKLNIPALADRKHPDFGKYKGLRTNLEVLRNDIIGQYLDDGGFDQGDEVFIPPIRGIAEALGDALANGRSAWKRPFVNSFNFDVANVEAVGAAEMYKYLLDNQQKKSIFAPLKSSFRQIFGLPDNNWGLLPLERTAFSPEGLSAPPPRVEDMIVDPQVQQQLEPQVAEHRALESLNLIGKTNGMNQPVAKLSDADKQMSVEDGRTILRWLRNLQGVDMDVQDFLSAGTPAEQVAKAEALGKLVTLYTTQMHMHPELRAEADVQSGGDAAGGASMMIAEHALSMLPQNTPAYALLAAAVDSMPERHYDRSTQSVSRLLEHMEKGLARLSGRAIGDRSPLERLMDASARIHQHAHQLRSVEALDTPQREESVELGREILRKLRMSMRNDKPMAEQLDAGKPEEKAELIEKIDELIEIYRNILAVATHTNPGLADDPRIKKANDAVGGMTHGIKLMASKEVPGSMAQAQQIGADITQDPTEWKNLQDRAVDRLIDSMEGGLEAAVDSMEQQEQDQEKDADLAQEAVDSAISQSDSSRRKRRKRRQQKSGMSGKKAEKKMRDTMADDRAAGQGRFSEERQQKKEDKQSAYMGLNEGDIASIRSLGSALRASGNEAKSLPPPDMSENVAPNDKTNAERAIEQITSSKRNSSRRNTK